jgi:ABC-type multidrug transport system fused ATPase/permease subunit
MTLTVADTTEHASPMRGLLPLWVGVFIYGLFVLAGNRLLIDPDTLWHITVGQWMVYRLAGDLFAHVQRRSLIFHSKNSVGDSISRITSDS